MLFSDFHHADVAKYIMIIISSICEGQDSSLNLFVTMFNCCYAVNIKIRIFI